MNNPVNPARNYVDLMTDISRDARQISTDFELVKRLIAKSDVNAGEVENLLRVISMKQQALLEAVDDLALDIYEENP